MALCLASFLAAAVIICGFGWSHQWAPNQQAVVRKESVVERALRMLRTAEQQKSHAHASLQAVQESSESLRIAVELKRSEVNKLQALLISIQRQKGNAEARKKQAQKAAEKASELEESTALHVEKMQTQATVARKLAAAKAQEAQNAWAAANTAQQSAQVANSPYIVNLVREAQVADREALAAKKQVDRANAALARAESEKTMAWISASSEFEERKVADAVYEAKCEALANAQAAYSKASRELVIAQEQYAPMAARIKQMTSAYQSKVARVQKVQQILQSLGVRYLPTAPVVPSPPLNEPVGKTDPAGDENTDGNAEQNTGSSEEDGDGTGNAAVGQPAALAQKSQNPQSEVVNSDNNNGKSSEEDD